MSSLRHTSRRAFTDDDMTQKKTTMERIGGKSRKKEDTHIRSSSRLGPLITRWGAAVSIEAAVARSRTAAAVAAVARSRIAVAAGVGRTPAAAARTRTAVPISRGDYSHAHSHVFGPLVRSLVRWSIFIRST